MISTKQMRQQPFNLLQEVKGTLIATLVTGGSYSLKQWLKAVAISFAITSAVHVVTLGRLGNLTSTAALSVLLAAAYLIYKRLPFFNTMRRIIGQFSNLSPPPFEAYSPRWEAEFQAEKKRIEDAILPKFQHLLRGNKGIQHIGSTSIKDIIIATPIHDMILGLNCTKLPREFVKAMEEIGYDHVGVAPHDADGNDNWFFHLPEEEDKGTRGYGFDLHVCLAPAHEHMDSLVTFSEYLNQVPEERRVYETQKTKLSKSPFPTYKRKKSVVVMELMSRALEWKQQTNANRQQ